MPARRQLRRKPVFWNREMVSDMAKLLAQRRPRSQIYAALAGKYGQDKIRGLRQIDDAKKRIFGSAPLKKTPADLKRIAKGFTGRSEATRELARKKKGPFSVAASKSRSKKMKDHWKGNPALRKRYSKKFRAQWNDPQMREKLQEGMRTYHDARKSGTRLTEGQIQGFVEKIMSRHPGRYTPAEARMIAVGGRKQLRR